MNIEAKELVENAAAKVVAKVKATADAGAPITLYLASVIRAEARASRDLELGRDTITLADWMTLETFAEQA